MRLADAIARYVDLKQSMGMRFRSERQILLAFHRQVGDVHVADVSTEAIATFLSGRGLITPTWLKKHRVLRAFFRHWMARGHVSDMPVPTVVPRITSAFAPHIYDNDELRRLLAAIDANQARPGCQISARTFRVLLLLLSITPAPARPKSRRSPWATSICPTRIRPRYASWARDQRCDAVRCGQVR